MKRALISVSNKDGVVEFSRGLVDLGYEIISTGGTYQTIKDAGIPVRKVSDITGFPEILDGRVKTCTRKFTGVYWLAAPRSIWPSWKLTRLLPSTLWSSIFILFAKR